MARLAATCFDGDASEETRLPLDPMPRPIKRFRRMIGVLTGIGLAISLSVSGIEASAASAAVSVSSRLQSAASFTSAPAPVISGSAIIGGRLQVKTPTWTPVATRTTYAWFSGGVVLPGKTAASYTVQVSDAGKTITVKATGSRTGVAARTETSSPTQVVPAPARKTFTAPIPTVTGTAKVGSTLSAKAGAWNPVAVYGYQWSRNGAAVAGRTASTYRIDAADAGARITVAVTGTKTGYAAASRTSAAVIIPGAPVTPTTPPTSGAVPFENSAKPTLSGASSVGSTVKADVSSWRPSDASLQYTWWLSNVKIDGQTSSSYVLRSGDLGKKITVTVTGSKAGYVTTAQTSAGLTVTAATATPTPTPTPTASPVPPVKVPFENSPKPIISGASSVGSTVRADVSSWRPSDASLQYTWWLSNVKIDGQTSSSYVLRSGDLGKKITVTVTGSKAGYVTTAQTSAGLTVTPGTPPTPVDQGYDVVAVMGQSNAQGAGIGFDPAIDVTVPGLYQLAGSGPDKGKIVPASDSLRHVTTWITDGEQRVGPAMEFGRELLAANPNRKVLLVPAAQGSTAMLKTPDDANNIQKFIWNPTPDGAAEQKLENLYTRALTQIDLALANPGSRLVAVIWAQGETDTGVIGGLPVAEQEAATAVYRARLLELIDGMTSRYGPVPFLIGGMVPEWVAEAKNGTPVPARASMSQLQQSIPGLRKNVFYVPGVKGAHNTFNISVELVHYNAAGARTMGDGYYAAYLAAIR